MKRKPYIEEIVVNTVPTLSDEISVESNKIARQLGAGATDKQIADRLAGMGYHRRDIAEVLNA